MTPFANASDRFGMVSASPAVQSLRARRQQAGDGIVGTFARKCPLWIKGVVQKIGHSCERMLDILPFLLPTSLTRVSVRSFALMAQDWPECLQVAEELLG